MAHLCSVGLSTESTTAFGRLSNGNGMGFSEEDTATEVVV